MEIDLTVAAKLIQYYTDALYIMGASCGMDIHVLFQYIQNVVHVDQITV